MSNEHEFSGTIVRVEPDGFGIVRFDTPLGANTHGVFSTSITVNSSLPFGRMKPGVHVTGTAETDARDLAAVKSLQVESVP